MSNALPSLPPSARSLSAHLAGSSVPQAASAAETKASTMTKEGAAAAISAVRTPGSTTISAAEIEASSATI